MSSPATESPILVGFLEYQNLYSYLDTGIPIERKPLYPQEVWINYGSIPPTPPTPSPFPGTAGPFTTGILDEPLFPVVGSSTLFAPAPPSRMANVLPGNIQNQAYRCILRDATGKVIPYNPGVWVADGVDMVVSFNYKTPQALGYVLPLSLTYWVYTGAIAGSSVGLMTITNEGAGAGQVFDTIVAGTAFLRTLTPDPTAGLGGISISTPVAPGTEIWIGNTMTGANVGGGPGTVFSVKTAAGVLQFNTISAGPGIGVMTGANQVIITNTDAGSAVTLSNAGTVGGNQTLVNAGTGPALATKGLNVGTGGLSIAATATDVTLDNTLTGANLGGGAGMLFSAKSGASLQFNTLAGTANGLTVSAPVGNVITIDNTLTGANVGAGTGTVFSAKSGATLQFNSLAGTANGLTVSAPVGNVITIDNTLTGANPSVTPGAVGVFNAKSGATLNFRSLVAGTNVTLTPGAPTANDVTIAVAGVVTTLANEGGGAQVWDATTTATLRTLLGTANGLTVTQNATTITIDNTLTGANVGAGAGTIFNAKSGATLQFNSLAGTANGLTVSAPAGNVITIDNTLTGANPSATPGAVGVFNAKSGAVLNFNSLVAGTNITLTAGSPTASDITIAAASGITTLANEGAGAQVWDAATAATLRTLLGTANGLTVTQNAMTITIDNTLTGANPSVTPGAASIFTAKSGAALNFRSLVAGANIALTANVPTVNDITIAVTGVVTTLANEGGGAQVWDSATAATLRTLLGTANGLTVTQNAATITIDNTLTGANVGAGTGTVFSAKSGATLQFNSLAGTANGLTVSAPAGNVITIDNTLTGTNVGAGTGTVFSAKSGATLQFNSLAGTANGLTVSAPAGGVITIDNTLTGANPSVTVGAVGVFNAKSGATLNFRSLVAGANITLTSGTPTANDITIAATGVVTTLANEGAGAQVWDSATAATLRTLLGTANGLTVTQNATTITIDNTLTGANPSVTPGAVGVFDAKSGRPSTSLAWWQERTLH